MHGLVGKALEGFLLDRHGAAVRDAALEAAGVPDGFRSTRSYPGSVVAAVLREAALARGLPPRTLLIDLGIWLVSRPQTEPLRRLIRFGGADFRGLLHSLEELGARGRLAMPDLELPRVMLEDRNPVYELRVSAELGGAGWVLTGLLRAMADDYGVLALVEHGGRECRGGQVIEIVRVEVADDAHAVARRFELAPALQGAA